MFRIVSLASTCLLAALGLAACEKGESARPAETGTTASNQPVVPKAPSGPSCKVSKDCPAGNVCVAWVSPTGDKANPPACGNEVYSGNGQVVTCASDADCDDERIGQVSDIKAFKGQLVCRDNAPVGLKTCTTK